MDFGELDADAIKQVLLGDADMRRQFLSLPLDSELGMSGSDLPGGNSIAVLSPAYSSKAVYFSPSINLAPFAEIAVEGNFEAITPEGIVPLPVQAVERCGRSGVGWPDTALDPFTSPIQNNSGSRLRLALRLLPISELPQRFLLFFPWFNSSGLRSSPPPIVLSSVAGRGLCIFRGVVQPTVQPDDPASGTRV